MDASAQLRAEKRRLETLSRYEILDTPLEKDLDNLTALAAQICGTPIALISLLDEKRQWFKSCVGLKVTELARDNSFCEYTIRQSDVFIIPDAARDERFAGNALVTGAPNARFYAGSPLLSPDGHALGTLCVIDREPREMRPEQQEALRILSRQVMAQFELRRRTSEEVRALQERERMLSEVQRIGRLGSWQYEISNDKVTWSEELYRIFGLKPDQFEATFQGYLSRVHPEDRARTQTIIENAFRDHQPFEFEERIVQPGGAVRILHSRGHVDVNSAGQPVCLTGVCQDITANRNLEAQFRQSQKMEAFGLLAGGVAHDFNNLLSVVIGYCDIWLVKLPPDAPIRGPLKTIKNAGDRAAALTKQLLAFSRQTVLESKVLDLNSVVRDTEKMLARLIGEDIELTSILNPIIPRIKVDPSQIGQALINLAVNSRDAMPRGGSLTLQTGTADFDEAYVLSHPGAKIGRQVVLTVSDTGCGMTPEVMARIFEPFFTTKGVGKGTGLGLAVVHGIVSQSGGTIQVESTVNAGTTFRLYFPITSEAFQSERISEDIVSHAGVETILVVEDEHDLRDLTEECLQSSGYKVVTARAGREAIDLMSANPVDIDLMVTDVVMPGMSGPELADTLQRQMPKLKVLFMSGYTEDAVVRHGINHEKVAFLQKPFTPFDLIKKVRSLLDQR